MAAKHLRFKQLGIPVSYWYYCVLDARSRLKARVLLKSLNGQNFQRHHVQLGTHLTLRHKLDIVWVKWQQDGASGQPGSSSVVHNVYSREQVLWEALPLPVPQRVPLDSSLTSMLVSCKDRFTDTSLTFRQVFVPWKVTKQMSGKNLSSIADAKHWVEATSTDYFGKGRQVEILNYWAVSFSCTSPAFQTRQK